MQISALVVAAAAADLSRGEFEGLSSGSRGEQRWSEKKEEGN